jgi:two-component system, oxyanion-binding sensor
MTGRWQVRAGFIPLVDAAPLIAAREIGFAAEEGIDLVLSREMSWATIRDRLAVSHLDVAHALAPLPLAAQLGLSPLSKPLIVPMALGFGGNTVTLSRAMWKEVAEAGATPDFDPLKALAALRKVTRARKEAGRPRPVFAIVHPYSAHHYELAYWLAAAGLLAGRDYELVVLPPPLMPAALSSGGVDGFCAGEPWGNAAATENVGAIVATKAHIWRSSPDKVLAVRRSWAEEDPDRVAALLRAIYRAAVWCDLPENRETLANILARSDLIGLPASLLRASLDRELTAPDGTRRIVPHFLTFADHAATFPWISHALWFLAQMARWGEVALNAETISIVRETYRPDIYRAAIGTLGVSVPSASSKVEGALVRETPVGSATGRLVLGPDGFFDGRVFDPDCIQEYVAELRAADQRA